MSKIPGFRSGKAWKKVVAVISYLFIAFVIVGMFGNKDKPTTAIVPVSTSVSAPSAAPPPPAQSSSSTPATAEVVTAPAPATPSVKTYKPGMYKIGVDMPAGEYTLIAKSTAYFQVAKDSTGQMDSIISNDNFNNRSIVTVADGQYLTLKNCTAYAFKDAPKVDIGADGFLQEGMYKVGVDLPAGEYKVTADSMGYAEVSGDSSHDMGSIISNDNFQGEKYITVKDGQYLKLTRAKIKVR